MGYFFAGCTNAAELKDRYRALAKKHHPDLGGNEETFKAVAAEYEAILAGKPVPKKPVVWGKVKRRNRIIKLVKIQRAKQLKPMFVYHAYLKTLAENGQQLTRTDLEFMAAALGFKSGWIEIISKQNNII